MRDGAIIVHSGEEEAALSIRRPLSTTCIPTLCAGPMAALFDLTAPSGCGQASCARTAGGSVRPSDGLGTHRLGSLGWAHSALPGAKVSVGYTQLYNEAFSDLLCPLSSRQQLASTPAPPDRTPS